MEHGEIIIVGTAGLGHGADRTGEDYASQAMHSDGLLAEGRRIVESADRAGLTLRLTGGIGVYHYAIDRRFAEREHTDIDLVGLKRQSSAIADLFSSLGYRENTLVSLATGSAQMQFYRWSQAHDGPRSSLRGSMLEAERVDHIDVFLDAMNMDHTLQMRDRLTLESCAISPADLLLSKLQIARLAEKDIHDVITLCASLPGESGDWPGVLNLRYLAETCADDWGLFIDVLANSENVLTLLDCYPLTERDATHVRSTLELAQQMVTDQPKSLRFRLRARVGRRLPWRREVEETQAVRAASARPASHLQGGPAGRRDAAA